ncbi:MAG TPA: hypothetical protein VGL42_01745 [Opitutaceae bacterium]|jgi:hypothetical protein
MKLTLAFVFATAFAGAISAAPIRHDFLALDEGLGDLMHVDESKPARNWLVNVGHSLPRDMQLEGGGKLLISHDQGYSEYDIATGRKLKDVALYHDVSSVRRLPNGHLLIAGVDFDGKKLNRGHDAIGDPTGRHVLFVEYDADGNAVARVNYIGDYLRVVRETASGTFLCPCNDRFREADGQGNWIHDFPVPGFRHAWKAVRLADGKMLMSGGFGAFMAETDPSGAVLRHFGGVGQVPAEIHPYFYGLFQLLPNGNVVAANWQGHRAGHNYSGEQLVEFDPAGKVVWTWSDRAFVSSVQGVLVLDGLDIQKLHDEREGLMAPLP